MSRRALATSYFYSRALIALALIAPTSAYNIDTFNTVAFNDPTFTTGERSSYFGFSVALFAAANESLLLVGAPRANSSGSPSVVEPGTVFRCSISGDKCEEWIVDRTGNGPRGGFINQIKDNAWIGATIAAENKTVARIVVCGPRWINNIINGNRPYWYMNGICYSTLASDVHAFEKEAEEQFHPLSDLAGQITSKNKIGIYNYGMGQVGFSSHMNSRRHAEVALGSPGVYNWKGNVILNVASTRGPFSRTVIPSLAEEQQVHSYNYLGYAVTSGTYFNEQDVWYASSAPKGANMNGKVLIFTFPTATNKRIYIRTMVYGQYGEYFGAAMTSCDVNNDRKDELIVGAPQWSKDMDEGHVYIFTARHNENFEELQTIEGEVVGGRFGSTVMCLGDVDRDGYGDIAIGAPYEEESGGAVYIFNGNKNGVSRRYSQRLTGAEFTPAIRGFGISISEPRDVNRDCYPEIAVGAYRSDKAILLRSTPVVTANVTLTYLQKVKLLRNTTSFVIDVAMSYDGVYVPERLRVIAILKIDPMHGRAAYFAEKSNDGLQVYRMNYTLRRGTVMSNWHEIHLKANVENVIDPLDISVSMEFEDDLHARNEGSFCSSCVVVNRRTSNTEDVIKLPFVVDCGDDDTCESDLSVTLSTDANPRGGYVIGSTPTITLRVDARNRGEPAYRTLVHIFTGILSLASVPAECTEDTRNSSALAVICDVGNPLRTNKTLTLQLDISMPRYDVREVELRANISTQSDDVNWNDNSYAITVYFDVDIDIAIAGKAQENLYSYIRENEEKPLNNIRFQHLYEIQTFGVSPIEEVVLTVKIPTHIRRYDTEEDTMIVSVDDIVGRMNGYQFYCSDSNRTENVLSVESEMIASTDNAIVANSSKNVDGNRIENDAPTNVRSENKTFYVNCTNRAIYCTQIDCTIGPFLSSLSVAKFSMTLDLQLSNFPADVMKDKDTIFYVTEGSVTITQPRNVVQRDGHKPDITLVGTTIVNSSVVQRIAIWIIALSVILGIALLILLILGLIKIGFFNRKKKIELEALKAETDNKYNVVLETTSSAESLDCD